jgi:hypothetical protein
MRQHRTDGLREIRRAYRKGTRGLDGAFLVDSVPLVQGKERLHEAGCASKEATGDVESVAAGGGRAASVEGEARLPKLFLNKTLL